MARAKTALSASDQAPFTGGCLDPTERPAAVQYGGAVEVFIDADDQRSLVEQVYAQVRSAIVEGRLALGDPSRRAARSPGNWGSPASPSPRRTADWLLRGQATMVP
jgi:hypothetical protein